jgi:hypothetical protein
VIFEAEIGLIAIYYWRFAAGNFMTSNRTLLALCALVAASWIALMVALWWNPLW